METNYNHGYLFVNNQGCLTDNNHGCSVQYMNYSERLKKARNHAGLTQKALVEKLGRKPDGNLLMSQANLAKMEKNPKTQGSMFTVLIAKACEVNAEWLTLGVGDMLDRGNENVRVDLSGEGQKSNLGVKQVVAEYNDERDKLLYYYAGISKAHKTDLMMMAEAWFKVDNPELLPIVDDTTPETERRKAHGM